MALAGVEWPCCSPAKTPCSLAPFNRRCSISRTVLASRLVVRLSSAELRLQDPLDSARRPSVPITEDEDDGGNRNCPSVASTPEVDSVQIDVREQLRRKRISLANKGRTPWNKGKHHSPETIARLRERNKIVMQDPKIREKLRQHSHPQSQDTREKIRIFMKARMQFERTQLTIVQEWKDSIAETARLGFLGDGELQWAIYPVLKAELRRQYYASTEGKNQPKNVLPRSCTLEQRLKISESVRAKWADPEFRKRMMDINRQSRHRGQGKRIFQEKLSDTEFDNILNALTSSPVCFPHDNEGPSVAKVGSYNDPLSEEKLKKIQKLRVRSVSQKETEVDTETAGAFIASPEKNVHLLHQCKPSERQMVTTLESSQMAEMAALQQAQREATEKARILLAEAERAAAHAARALDAAGDHDESLSDSLLEARTLLDEANKSILNMEVEVPVQTDGESTQI